LDFFYSYSGNVAFFYTCAGFFYARTQAHLVHVCFSILPLRCIAHSFYAFVLDLLAHGACSYSPHPLFLFYSYAGNHRGRVASWHLLVSQDAHDLVPGHLDQIAAAERMHQAPGFIDQRAQVRGLDLPALGQLTNDEL
jgi:hypothetical protein